MVLGNGLGIHCYAISEGSTIKTQWRIQDFPGDANSRGGVRQPIILQNCCRKLHEKSKNLDRGGMRVPGRLLGSATEPTLIMSVKGIGVVLCEHSLRNGSFTLIES